MKVADLFEDAQFDKELLDQQAVRGRKDVERIKGITRTMSDGNKGAKNVEHGFRSALKRQYKKIAKQEEQEKSRQQ